MVSDFKEKGFYAQSSLFTKEALQKYSLEFDRIVTQLKESGEVINARWGSELTKDIEQSESQVIHTHNVQSYSAEMMAMIQNEQFLDAVEELIGPDIMLHHTKLFLKPPGNGSAFPLHQDWSYFPTEKNTMIAAVIHISDSKKDMGCIRVVPGSHKLGKIRNSDGHSFIKKIHGKHSLDEAMEVRASRGDVLFFHCCTVHGSKANNSPLPRKTIVLQLYSGKDVVERNKHTNVQLTLRGWNYHATRNNIGNIKT